jgi:hypothetical protein
MVDRSRSSRSCALGAWTVSRQSSPAHWTWTGPVHRPGAHSHNRRQAGELATVRLERDQLAAQLAALPAPVTSTLPEIATGSRQTTLPLRRLRRRQPKCRRGRHGGASGDNLRAVSQPAAQDGEIQLDRFCNRSDYLGEVARAYRAATTDVERQVRAEALLDLWQRTPFPTNVPLHARLVRDAAL